MGSLSLKRPGFLISWTLAVSAYIDLHIYLHIDLLLKEEAPCSWTLVWCLWKMSFNLQLENLVVLESASLQFFGFLLVSIQTHWWQLYNVLISWVWLDKTAQDCPNLVYVVRCTYSQFACLRFFFLFGFYLGWLVPIIQREINLYDPTRLYRTHPIRTCICTLHYPDWQLYKAKGFISVGYD